VTTRRLFDVAVLGAGPAGLTAALQCAETRRVVVCTPRVLDLPTPLRVDCIPAQTLVLLGELGIEPTVIGASLPTGRVRQAWTSSGSEDVLAARTFHIERHRLDRALLARALSNANIEFTSFVHRPEFRAHVFVGDGWRAPLIIDASGSAAVMAPKRFHPVHPWAARTWLIGAKQDDIKGFQIAALPEGYVYRLGTGSHTTVGVVGASRFVRAKPEDILARLQEVGCGWILEALEPFTKRQPSWGGRGSLQWSSLSMLPVLPVGDAAIARDPLSSQGLATALSDALSAAAVVDDAALELFRSRHCTNLANHISSLASHLRSCRWRDAPVWAQYLRFLMGHAQTSTGTVTFLSHGRLTSAVRAS
jgi:2-polyprenyl-6-methoxyphenol hydroxylase-like FAD-dependent oxidoreductase